MKPSIFLYAFKKSPQEDTDGLTSSCNYSIKGQITFDKITMRGILIAMYDIVI